MAQTLPYVSRAGLKMAHALQTFSISPAGWTCADLGCSTADSPIACCKMEPQKYMRSTPATAVLDWKLRKDPRVVVMERINAMHVQLPKAVSLVTIDVAWTKQRNILPSAHKLLRPDGIVISLIKPHYERRRTFCEKGF